MAAGTTPGGSLFKAARIRGRLRTSPQKIHEAVERRFFVAMVESPFDVLGLAPDASLVEIKKAYARLLKVTRPDSDLAAFQRLEEAYSRCIQIVRTQQQAAVHAALASTEPRAASKVQDTPRPEGLPISLAHTPPAQPRPRELPPEALEMLLDSIAEAATHLGGNEFEDWLENKDELLSLDVQMQVARALPAFVVRHPAAFDSLYIQLVYDYLTGATVSASSFGDPALQRAWEQAHASTSFAETLTEFRRSDLTAMERLALAELLDAPDARRRRFLDWYPFARSEVEAMFNALCSLDDERGPAAVRSEAAARWLPPRGGSRPLQQIEPAAWVFGSVSAIWLGLTAVAPKPPPLHWSAGVLMVALIALATFLFAGRVYASALRQLPRANRERVAPGPDSVGLWTCLLTLPAIAACMAQAAWPHSGFVAGPLAIIVGMFMAVVLVIAGKFRFEAIVLYIALVYALLRALWPLGGGAQVAEDAFAGMSFAAAALGGWLVDRAYAYWVRLPVAEARKQFSLPILLFALLVWLVAYIA